MEKQTKGYEGVPAESRDFNIEAANLKTEAGTERFASSAKASIRKGLFTAEYIKKVGGIDRIKKGIEAMKKHKLSTTEIEQAIPQRLGMDEKGLEKMLEDIANSKKSEYEKSVKNMYISGAFTEKDKDTGKIAVTDALRRLDEDGKLSPEFKKYITQNIAQKSGLNDQIFSETRKGEPKIKVIGKYEDISKHKKG